MTSSFLTLVLRRISARWPLLISATVWTSLLTLIVAVASFSPEVAFVSAITPNSSFSQACQKEGLVRVPFDLPNEVFCLPAQFFKRSKMDLVVPPVFAAVIVAASAYCVRALGLWEVDVETH